MKQLILFVAILIGFVSSAIAQLPTTFLNVDNRTACTVYVEIWGKSSLSASCNHPFINGSGIIAIAPSTFTYTDVTAVPIPGLVAGDQFVAADIYDADPNLCTFAFIDMIGEPCGSYPPTSVPYDVYDSGCATCATNITATWDIATHTLIFQ